MFKGFTLEMIETPETAIRVRHGGCGPPVLLLHGHPQTHFMWHKVAPLLASEFTVVAADLRGYGQSSKPRSTPDHESYSKRAMARDQLAVMRTLGFDRFAVVGHDRGGRCAYRMALDFPDNVVRLAVLDIVPTFEAFRRTDMKFALAYWHWFFMAQPFDLPEHLIGQDPEWYFRHRKGPQVSAPFDSDAEKDYLEAYLMPETRHAMCEDYRAGATIDYALDESDYRSGRKIQCPLLALWAAQGDLGNLYNVLDVWREWCASTVEGSPLQCGHYLAEEAPAETHYALRRFLAA